ncbi:tetratricopeptide repeat protein [Amycolatopsis japonica]
MTANKDSDLGTVVICTALDVEYRSVREHLPAPLEEREVRGALYEISTFPTDHGRWTVALAQSGAGNTQAGIEIERAISFFHPRYVLFVGVAGGRKDVACGDVVIADYVYDYESGKDTGTDYLPRIKTAAPSNRLLRRAQQIARDDIWQHRILPTVPDAAPKAVVKPVAAGCKVVADQNSATAQFLNWYCGDAAAVEMEGHGFLHGAYVNDAVEALVVRGISDLLSGKTETADLQWQPIASQHAAAFAFELLSRSTPPPSYGASQLKAVPRRGLPRRRTLVGRETEIGHGRTLLAGRDRPVLVVHGPPGVGKTVLAEQIAYSLQDDFVGGVVVVDVPAQEDMLVLVLLALDPGGQVPGDRHQRLARVAALLARSRVLLVLDNVRTEESLEDLLRADGDFAVICTSRSRLTGLACDGIESIEVAPLLQKDAAQLARSVAERLTPEESDTLATVCGGLPIAVLIASARIKKRPHLSVLDYLAELADPDHGTDELRAGEKSIERIIEDSYQLLNDEQTRIILALGLLPNTNLAVEVAAAGCSLTIEEFSDSQIRSARRLLDDLVELHLVEQVDEETVRLHDVLYRFARHKAGMMDLEWRNRVIANGCLAFAARTELAVGSIGYVDADARIPSENNTKALAILEQDHAGAVSMVEKATERGLWDEFITLTHALVPALQHLGRWGELTRVATCLKDAGSRTGKADWTAAGLLNLGTAAARKGETEEAIALYRQCFKAAESPEDVEIAESARTAYGNLLLNTGHAAEALPVLRRSLFVWRIFNHDLMLAETLNSLGKANLAMVKWARAEAYFRNALRVVRRAGIGGLLSPFGIALAQVQRMRGRCFEAKLECSNALERARAVGNREVEADALRELALIESALGDDKSLLDTLASALAIYREVGDVRSQVSTLLLMGSAAEDEGDREQAMRHLIECADMAEDINDLRHSANALSHIANLYSEAGQHDHAEEYLQCAVKVAEDSGSDLLMLQVQHQQVRMLRRVGKIEEIVPLLRRTVSLFESAGESDVLASARASLGEALVQQGKWQEAAPLLQSVADAPGGTVSLQVRASAFRFLATLYSRRELWPEASHAAEQALTFAEKSLSRSEMMHCRHAKGNVLARMSKWSEAAPEYEESARLAIELRDFQTMLIIRANQASCENATGDTVKAIATIRRSLPTAGKLGLEELHATLLLNMGAILAGQQDFEAAKSEFERAFQIAISLGNKILAANAAESLAKVYTSLGDLNLALRWIHESRLHHQRAGDPAAAAGVFEHELLIRNALAIAAGEELDKHPLPEDVPASLLSALFARRETGSQASGSPAAERIPGQRSIIVAQEIVDELAGLNLEIICQRLVTGRRHCVACRLSIAEEGAANLIILRFQSGPLGVTLAHPSCLASSVVAATQGAEINTVRFEVECYIWRDDLPGVFVDTKGPWGTNEDGRLVDVFLESLRTRGFLDINSMAEDSLALRVPELAKETVRADLVGNKLTIKCGDEVVVPSMPLSFYPSWYRTARSGALIVVFGHDLRGMVADDPKYLINAAAEGNLVGAAIELNVVTPARSRLCICTPRTGLKFKHCCGALSS